MPFLPHILPVIGIRLKHPADVLPGLVSTGIVEAVEANSAIGHPENAGILPGVVLIKGTMLQYVFGSATIAGLSVMESMLIQPTV